MLKLVPAIVETRDFSNSSSGTQNDASRRNPFVCHIPTPNNCSLVANRNSFQNQASPLTQCVWTFFWLAMLLFVAYPLGFLGGQLYILVSPFTTINFCKKIMISKMASSLLWTMHLPLICSQNMIAAKALIDAI